MEDCIRDEAPSSFLDAHRKSKKQMGTLEFMKDWAEEMLASRLPLQVDEVKIYPEDMTLSTLQFTERLGYKQKNAVDMITMGCYNTLMTIKTRLDKPAGAGSGRGNETQGGRQKTAENG